MSESEQTKPDATELEWLTWFCQNADFGPSEGDVRDAMQRQFEKQTDKRVPRNWRSEE